MLSDVVVTEKFQDKELRFLVDCLNGTMISLGPFRELLVSNVEDNISLDKRHARYGVDPDEITEKVKSLSEDEVHDLLVWINGFKYGVAYCE